jgi:HEPN domain-containing protein
MTGKRRAEATRWFQQALYDLRAARWNIEGGFHDTASFLAQQAGEKAVKSLLYYVGSRRTALLTHSVVEMVRTIGKRVEALRGLMDEARELDLHYIPHALYGRETAEKVVGAADRIVSAVSDYYRTAGEAELLNPPDGG